SKTTSRGALSFAAASYAAASEVWNVGKPAFRSSPRAATAVASTTRKLKRPSHNQTRWRDGSDVVPLVRRAMTCPVLTAGRSPEEWGHDVGAVAPAQK